MYFSLLLGLLAFIPRSLADVDLEVREPLTHIEVIYHWSDDGATESIMALNGNGETIGSAKGATLNTGNFADTPITINFANPPKPAGIIVVGGTTFPLRSNEEDTTSPDCGRISGPGMVEASCLVQIKSNIFSPQPLSADKIHIDLSDSLIREQLNGETFGDAPEFNTTEADDAATPDLVERQCTFLWQTDKADRPDPHQWHLARQRSVSAR
jgi:hypothetical protein